MQFVIFCDGVEYWTSDFPFSAVEMLHMLVVKNPDNHFHLRCIPYDL